MQPPSAPPAPAKPVSFAATRVLGALAMAAWIWLVISAINEKKEVDRIARSSLLDASALQISQLVDQALLSLAVPFSIALGLSVLYVVSLGSAWMNVHQRG